MSNLDLWNSVEKTNPSHTKPVNFGRKITAIDPYQQMKSATEKFGAVGIGWGWSVVKTDYLPTNEVAVLIRMWHGDKSNTFDHWGQNSLYTDKAQTKVDGDCLKKATTDGITKCLSMIGFNVDVFLGKFDDNKYVNQLKEDFAEPVAMFALDEVAIDWIEAIKSGRNKIEEITDPQYKAFIKGQL